MPLLPQDIYAASRGPVEVGTAEGRCWICGRPTEQGFRETPGNFGDDLWHVWAGMAPGKLNVICPSCAAARRKVSRGFLYTPPGRGTQKMRLLGGAVVSLNGLFEIPVGRAAIHFLWEEMRPPFYMVMGRWEKGRWVRRLAPVYEGGTAMPLLVVRQGSGRPGAEALRVVLRRREMEVVADYLEAIPEAERPRVLYRGFRDGQAQALPPWPNADTSAWTRRVSLWVAAELVYPQEAETPEGKQGGMTS